MVIRFTSLLSAYCVMKRESKSNIPEKQDKRNDCVHGRLMRYQYFEILYRRYLIKSMLNNLCHETHLIVHNLIPIERQNNIENTQFAYICIKCAYITIY